MDIKTLSQFKPQLSRLAHKYGISRMYVFGSVARGDSNSSSDVDLILEMQPGASLFGAAGFSHEAEKLLNLKVDIVPYGIIHKLTDHQFVENVQREAVEL